MLYYTLNIDICSYLFFSKITLKYNNEKLLIKDNGLPKLTPASYLSVTITITRQFNLFIPMKKKYLITALMFAAMNSTHAQTAFQQTFGRTSADNTYCVDQTTDGGYVLTGYTGSDVCLIKTSSDGTMEWSKALGGTATDYGYSVQQTSDGGFIITGYTQSFGAGGWDVYLIKTLSDGTIAWTKTYGGTGADYAQSVQQTTDGGYIIAGYTPSFGAAGDNVYLIKTNASGNIGGGQGWAKTYGGTGLDYGYFVRQTSDGGYIISGGTTSYGAGGMDVYLLKTSPDGTLQWTKTFGGTKPDYGESVQQTADGGFIIGGYTSSFGAGNSDMYLLKTSSDGTLQWTKTYGGTGWDYGYSVQQTTDGGFVIAGESNLGTGSYDFFLVKTTSDGSVQWTQTFGGTSATEIANSVQQTADGGYIIAGETNTFGAGSADFFLVKTDANGDVGCNQATPLNPVPGSGGASGTGGTASSGGAANSGGTASSPAIIANTLCATLGLKLLNFTASPGKNGVDLQWSSVTGPANDFFAAERSYDGTTFETIAKIKITSTSGIAENYSLIDEHPPAGIIYYRLKQIDYDGTLSISKIIMVNTEQHNNTEIYPYPNPASDVVTIGREGNHQASSGNTAAGKAEIIICDIFGRKLIRQDDMQYPALINIQGLPAGIYFVMSEGMQTMFVKE